MSAGIQHLTCRHSEMATKPEEGEMQKRQKSEQGADSSSSMSSPEDSEEEHKDDSCSNEDTFYDEKSGFVFVGHGKRCGGGGKQCGSDKKNEDPGRCPILRRQSSSEEQLTQLDFAFSLPLTFPTPTPQFRLAQGHRLMLTVTYKDSNYIFTVMALGKEHQKRDLNWPLRESFVLMLHKTRDREGRPMEGECPGPGKKGCSVEVHKNEIRKLGYVEEGMLHVTLKLNPKRVLPGNHGLTRRLPAQ